MGSGGSGSSTMDVVRNSVVAAADLTELPTDVFLLIISHLSADDSVRCRRVSRSWRAAFTSHDVSWNLMKWHFPRCREMRAANADTHSTGSPPTTEPEPPPPPLSRCKESPWAKVFHVVARRYHYLRTATPRLVEKIGIVQEEWGEDDDEKEDRCRHPRPSRYPHRGVEPWNRMLRLDKHRAEFQYRDPAWTLDDGLLVYREADSGRYVAHDLETRRRFSVPFEAAGKIVRRLRLACGVLLFEWCEREPYHQLNDREAVHRHFATAFDVRRPEYRPPNPSWGSSPHSSSPSSSSSSTSSPSPAPLSPRASVVRSAPPPSSWTIAFRSEWKIHFLGLPVNRSDRFFSTHTATHYAVYLWQPNRSPWGEEDPLEQLTVWDISFPSAYRPSLDPTGASRPDPDLAPAVVRRFAWRELDSLGLRQRHTPSLCALHLDDRNVYLHQEDHCWLVGPHCLLSPPRNHLVRSTGVPFRGLPAPRWFTECCADGDVHMRFCPHIGSGGGEGNGGGDDDATRVVRRRRRRAGPSSALLDDPAWSGWAPCWRHEEFPYLTVSDVTDTAAGVRVVARQCFMMEALSSFVQPRISVKNGGGAGGDGAAKKKEDEARFPDELWGELMGKGFIAGDERWIVGEDKLGRVTVVRF